MRYELPEFQLLFRNMINLLKVQPDRTTQQSFQLRSHLGQGLFPGFVTPYQLYYQKVIAFLNEPELVQFIEFIYYGSRRM